MPRKIKVSDITPENNEKDPVNDEVEEVKELEPIVEEEVKQEETPQETPQEIPQETPQEIPQPEGQTPTEIVEEVTKTRKQELKQFPKCKKWLTAKTLFYFHQCTKNDVPKAKRRPKKVIAVQDIEDIEDYSVVKTTTKTTSGYVEPNTPRMPKQIDYTPKIEISYEDMRRERIKQRIEQRSVKIKNLFSSAV